MELLTTYEEMAMAIQCEYEEELDETITNQELLKVAKEITRESFLDESDSAVVEIANEILKFYQPIN